MVGEEDSKESGVGIVGTGYLVLGIRYWGYWREDGEQKTVGGKQKTVHGNLSGIQKLCSKSWMLVFMVNYSSSMPSEALWQKRWLHSLKIWFIVD